MVSPVGYDLRPPGTVAVMQVGREAVSLETCVDGAAVDSAAGVNASRPVLRGHAGSVLPPLAGAGRCPSGRRAPKRAVCARQRPGRMRGLRCGCRRMAPAAVREAQPAASSAAARMRNSVSGPASQILRSCAEHDHLAEADAIYLDAVAAAAPEAQRGGPRPPATVIPSLARGSCSSVKAAGDIAAVSPVEKPTGSGPLS